MSFMLQITCSQSLRKRLCVFIKDFWMALLSVFVPGSLKRADTAEFQFMTEKNISSNNLFRTKPSMSYSHPGYLVQLAVYLCVGVGMGVFDPIVLCLSPMGNLFHCSW